jgi:uncharacterized GH25 family protein
LAKQIITLYHAVQKLITKDQHALAIAFTPLTLAHDFWLEPTQFQYDDASPIAVQFKVGHKDDINHWNLTWDKIVALRSYSSTGVVDMAAGVIPKSNLLPGMAKSTSLSAGSYVVGFESYHSVSVLKADQFNDYAKKEGLKEIVEYRANKGLEGYSGEELYSRKAKAIVQVGETLTDNVTKPIGHTLEIVPRSHPLKLGDDSSLTVQVLFKGEPLKDALIDSVPLKNATHEAQSFLTDDNGKATFTFKETGAVKLNVVWGVPLKSNIKADFETYFSSLTFAVASTK